MGTEMKLSLAFFSLANAASVPAKMLKLVTMWPLQ